MNGEFTENELFNLKFELLFRSKFLLPFDHHYSVKTDDEQNSIVTVVLYGDFGNQNEFKPFHNKLVSLALNGKIDYVLRHNSKVSN
jgi:hypothetical protein